ncbi:MAG: family 10 glycosylhydrolase [Dysgonomonas sp.]|nr:family 10 glycosylhydrolase [Dysgonomonas sp.]
MKRFFSILYIFIFAGLFHFPVSAQESTATEIRAAWLTTNWNLDWPKAKQSPNQQKQHLRETLDQLQRANFNTILLQVRVRGDVFYKSKIEPWSPFFHKSTVIGSDAPYDPLQFAIEECHKRGMECHAWFVTFPLGSRKQVQSHRKNSIATKRADICKLHQGEWYLDPGNPQAREYVLRLVDELVSNYDIDGIHFDYIRYPESAAKFPDQDTFRKYGNRQRDLKTWRRNNITTLVSGIYDLVKSRKPWVQVSCSPLGRYRDLDPRKGKWTAYGSVHQDAGKWMKDGKMDAVYPMLYYREQFGEYVEDWLQVSNGRFVVPGLGIYRMLSNEGNWSLSDITSQINYTRQSKADGAAFYRAGNVLDNTKGVLDALKHTYYAHPAKIPPMNWLNETAPNSPINMQVYRDTNGLITIEWESSNANEQQTYTVYESETEDFDINNPSSIIMTGIRGNKLHLNTPNTEKGIYFSITASNRFHNESIPCFPVYFILSDTLEK